jgi:LacI family transcriptional regulator
VERQERVTIHDVAARAGVSVSTVSKVINNRYGVAAATQRRVLEVIAESGYQASLVAQSLRNRRTNVIGVLVADLEPFTAELLKGAANAIRGSGFELVVYSAGGRPEDHTGWEQRYLSRLSGTLIDGAVLVTPTVVDVHNGAPIVAVDHHAGPTDLPTVDADNLRGGEIATTHLLDLGHRRIGPLACRADLESARQREQGYRKALELAGVPVDDGLIIKADYDPERSAEATRQLLTGPEPPTALFAANDVSAIAAMDVARDLGLRLPEDLSVVGFDNVPESALCTPRLTTVEQPIQEMGSRAVRLLIDLIEGADPGPIHRSLPTRLVARDSTRQLASGRPASKNEEPN